MPGSFFFCFASCIQAERLHCCFLGVVCKILMSSEIKAAFVLMETAQLHCWRNKPFLFLLDVISSVHTPFLQRKKTVNSLKVNFFLKKEEKVNVTDINGINNNIEDNSSKTDEGIQKEAYRNQRQLNIFKWCYIFFHHIFILFFCTEVDFYFISLGIAMDC